MPLLYSVNESRVVVQQLTVVRSLQQTIFLFTETKNILHKRAMRIVLHYVSKTHQLWQAVVSISMEQFP